MTVPMVFEENVKKHPNKVCFIFEGREWTFKEVCCMATSHQLFPALVVVELKTTTIPFYI